MVPRAEKESADSRVRAISLMSAGESVGSKSFFSWHFCELCFCQLFSSLLEVSLFESEELCWVKELVLPFECGAKKSMHLGGEDQPNVFVLTQLI